MRDGFVRPVKEDLARRVGYRCSNPQCRQQTSGPQVAEVGAVNIGVAAHIAAAARGGPRFNDAMSSEERGSAANGIWLCQTCAKLVDADVAAYPEALLQDWKQTAEAMALLELKGLRVVPDRSGLLRKLEDELSELFAEMRSDLRENPFIREFILIEKSWCYNADPNNPVLVYYFEEHPHLRQKMRLLENQGLVQNITCNNVDRFQFLEELVDYLKSDE